MKIVDRLEVTEAIVLHVCPRVQREDDQPVLDIDKGLALLDAFRSIPDEITVSRAAIDDLLKAKQAYLIRIDINGEPLFSMRLVP
jgi:hypothetical protein